MLNNERFMVHARGEAMCDLMRVFGWMVGGHASFETLKSWAGGLLPQCLMHARPLLCLQVLFSPRDIGLEQAGVAETVVQAVQAVHPALHPLLYSNVILTGVWPGSSGL